MIRLLGALHAWGTPDFKIVLKREIELLGSTHLPLYQGLSIGNHVRDDPVTVLIKHVAESQQSLRVLAGILYTGTIAGCSCTDDPTPNNITNEYCVVQLDIDSTTAVTTVVLIDETQRQY